MAKHNHLWENGKKFKMKVKGEEKEVVSNLAYLVGIIDMGTQKRKKWQSEDMEDVRMCKVEFEFPNIKRTYGDGKEGGHIKGIKTKISNYKASSDDMNNSKLVDIMIACGTNTLPIDNDSCLLFMKEKLLNKPVIVKSDTYTGNDGNEYDGIISFEKIEKKILDKLDDFKPSFGNSYFDFDNFSSEDFDNLQDFHKKEIEKSPEYKALSSEINESIDNIETDDLPFN